VLQGFNSNLTMLDGRAGAGGMSEESTPYDSGSERRPAAGGKSRGEPASGGSSSFDKDLDDEIPF
jgi:single-strand DNA-binding protein